MFVGGSSNNDLSVRGNKLKRDRFSSGKHILIHRKRSPFPPLGKVNCIRNFANKQFKLGKSNVFSIRNRHIMML